MKQPIVAIMYDFDKTLCTKDMQEYGFIPALGMSAADFWKEAAELTDSEEMDNVLAYMFKMVEKARDNKVKVKPKTFHKLGKEVEFFEGVATWFDRINKYGKDIGVKVEHYIVSSGIKEIIEGTKIAKYFKRIYACEFMYDHNGTIIWPKCAVNYTTKTQFLFRIKKGVLKVDNKSAEKHGGQSIAVYDQQKGKLAAQELKKDNRVNYVIEADYSEGGDLETVVMSIMNKIRAVEEMRSNEK